MELYFKDKYVINAISILRQCGYFKNFDRTEQKFSFIKNLSRVGHYPRFHVYIREENPELIHLNLHLDMKKETYAGAPRHGGEYDSEVVLKEGARIEEIFLKNKTTSDLSAGHTFIKKNNKAKKSFWQKFWRLLRH